MNKIKSFLLIFFLVLVSFILVWFFKYGSYSKNETVFCPADVKKCSDGSYVSRTGDKCEFALCGEGLNVKATTTKEIIPSKEGDRIVFSLNKNFNKGNFIFSLNKIEEDSRCPQGVACVWAGTVKVNITIDKEGIKENKIISLNDKFSVFGESFVFEEVMPGKQKDKEIKEGDYVLYLVVSSSSNK